MPKPDPRRAVDDFGRRVGELRRGLGWTQQELAMRLGVTLGYVQLIERGRENLTIESLALLAGVLRTLPAELLKPPKSRARRRPGRPRKTGQ
jgi:transcriptional regulator with XRE-family HTH domain